MQTHPSKSPKLRWLIGLLVLGSMLSACSDQTTTAAVEPKPAAKVTMDAGRKQATTHESANELVVLALGDSLTEGLGVAKDGNYPALLQQALHAEGLTQVTVVNSGLSGETSSGLLARVDWVLKQLQPDLTVLNIGANDAMRGLPLALTTQNIDTIIQRIQNSGSEVVLAGMQIYDNLGQEYVVGFKDLYPQLAEAHDLTLIPFFLEHVAGEAQFNQNDLIHPTQAGYAIIVERNVLPVVKPVIQDLIATRLQAPGPEPKP
ncbi:arylesterase [Marinicella meishanensis]|uniref:arylesterase n=1 Tax=Marinicella meishanensis TaxID=2873263 RepID=UPI001CBE5804|nr:arylesterase [Marinicella sp. NBU2979]